MTEVQAHRTLVKSRPELWAELSDAGSLARHLGEFGEIRITRIEPETTVAWEGAHASGTVEISTSGWGTRVTLTALPARQEAPPRPEPVPKPEPEPEPEPVPEPEPEPEPEPVPPPAREPEPQPEPPLVAVTAARTSFLGRLFPRRPALEHAPEPCAEVAPLPQPEPPPPAPEPEPDVEPKPDIVTEPDVEPEPGVEPEPSVDGDRALAILTAVLDDLGAAHHRPFSRA
jgi:hypothetical protein